VRDCDQTELYHAVNRAGSQGHVRGTEEPARDDAPAEAGRVVTVFSSKGGSGKSVVASNLAALLARTTGHDVALVDLDLESGDLAIMLQTVPSWTIHDAAEKAGLDTHALDGFLEKHAGGIHLLAAPTDPSLAGAVSEDAVRRILRLLRTAYPFVVVDGPATFTGQMLTALDETDDLVLVGALDVPTIKSTKIALLTLQRLGWSEDRIKLVVNRVEGKVGLQPRDVEKNLGMKVDVSLPTSPEVPLSVNEGVPLALGRKNGEVVTELAQLAGRLAGQASTGTAKPRRFWKR
jgi:pilus assembly protein CpaE